MFPNNKKGQLYLMAAVIIAFVLYVILSPSNIVRKTTETSNFQEIAKNFDTESARFLNDIIPHNQPIYGSFLNFTILFTSYSKTKNPDFGLIYSFIYKGKIYLGNYAQDMVAFDMGGQGTSINGCLASVQTSFSIGGLDMAIPNVNIMAYQHCLREIPLPQSFNNKLIVTVHESETNTDTLFTTELSPSSPDLIIISKEKKGNVRRIYTKGKFI